MENPQATIIYMPENRHLFSAEEQHFFEVTAKQAPTQPKYYRAQKRVVIEVTEKLFREKPEMSPRQVIRKVLKGMPDFLTGENLVQVVTYITEAWAKCQAEVAKQEPVAEEALA